MLISHRKKFIFTKTKKTAGTSVESVFEPFCMPEGTWAQMHYAPEQVSPDGVIGYRGPGGRSSEWWNHMSAELIRTKVGEAIWDDYFKFTVIRNPFDKLVSGFHMIEANRLEAGFGQGLKRSVKRLTGHALPIDLIVGETPVERFRSWILAGGMIEDRCNYMINDEVCVDYFIRFEALEDGLREVFMRIDEDPSFSSLPNFKSNFRKSKIPTSDYYDDETEAIVRQRFAWELDFFNYELS